MILPTKHIAQDRALLTVGARLLKHLSRPTTVSSLWEKASPSSSAKNSNKPALRYDSYILTLDLLFLMGVIEFQDGLVRRRTL